MDRFLSKQSSSSNSVNLTAAQSIISLISAEPVVSNQPDVKNTYLPDSDNDLEKDFSDNEFEGGIGDSENENCDVDSSVEDDDEEENEQSDDESIILASNDPLKRIYKQTKTVKG